MPHSARVAEGRNTSGLWVAAVASIAVHGALLWPGWRIAPPAMNVERGWVSREVELSPEAEADATTPMATPPPASAAEPWSAKALRPAHDAQPLSEEAMSRGAFVAAPSRGLQNRPPGYPWLARMRGWEGIVILDVEIEPEGAPRAVRVFQSSGHAVLDQAAQHAVQQWVFLPAHRGGRAVRSSVELPIRFQLTSSNGETP